MLVRKKRLVSGNFLQNNTERTSSTNVNDQLSWSPKRPRSSFFCQIAQPLNRTLPHSTGFPAAFNRHELLDALLRIILLFAINPCCCSATNSFSRFSIGRSAERNRAGFGNSSASTFCYGCAVNGCWCRIDRQNNVRKRLLCLFGCTARFL